MKAKWIGLLLLIVVALGAVGYVWFSQSTQVTEITGYVGGEKIGLLEDEQVQKILKDKYRLSLDYNRAGSIEMVTTLDRAGQDFLFPSNQTALELFEGEEGSPEKGQIVFNTPIVLYTHAAVAEALDGLPGYKMHCSVLAEEAIKAALADYYRRQGNAVPEELKLPCDGDEHSCCACR